MGVNLVASHGLWCSPGLRVEKKEDTDKAYWLSALQYLNPLFNEHRETLYLTSIFFFFVCVCHRRWVLNVD